MPIFKSKFVENAETIAAKLAKAVARVAALENELRSRAYDAALADDPDASLAPVRDQILVARLTVEALQHAAAEARRLEAGRLEKARFAARKAEFNAFKQHTSTLQRAVDEYQKIAGDLQSAWDRIVDAAQRAQRLVPSPDLEYPGLHPRRLAARGEVELARIGRRGEFWGPALFGRSAPGSMAAAIDSGTIPTDLQSFSAGVAAMLADYSERFKASLSLAPPSPPPVVTIPLSAQPRAPVAAEPAPAVAETPAAPVAPSAELVAPVDPYQPGDPEYEGYQAALAATQARPHPAAELVELSENV